MRTGDGRITIFSDEKEVNSYKLGCNELFMLRAEDRLAGLILQKEKNTSIVAVQFNANFSGLSQIGREIRIPYKYCDKAICVGKPGTNDYLLFLLWTDDQQTGATLRMFKLSDQNGDWVIDNEKGQLIFQNAHVSNMEIFGQKIVCVGEEIIVVDADSASQHLATILNKMSHKQFRI